MMKSHDRSGVCCALIALLAVIALSPRAHAQQQQDDARNSDNAAPNILEMFLDNESSIVPFPTFDPQAGACCFVDGNCVDLSGGECAMQGGDFQGEGNPCGGDPCPQPGACCFADGTCTLESVIGGASCVAAGGIYQGDDTLCITDPCPQPGACCLRDGTCEVTDLIDCIIRDGVFQGDNTTCASVTCTQPGACCFPDGTCRQETDVLGFDCGRDGGVYQGPDTFCATFACPQPGACCLRDGTCRQADATGGVDCLIQDGVYFGDDTLCADFTCTQPGACCLPDGTCRQETDVLGFDCSRDGGDYQGPDTDCLTVTCLGGACCLPTGECQDNTSQADCLALGGTWPGAGATCATVTCPGGACCLPNGACLDNTTEPGCAASGGAWQGLNSTCAASACPQPGACCLPDGSCRAEPAIGGAACLADGGTYEGDDTLCANVQCFSPLRVSSAEKGSLLFFSKIEIRWDAAGFLLQDTFLHLTNDHPDDVTVQLYFINGDPPLAADPVTGERAHPGWNWSDNQVLLTGDQPIVWSAVSGLPAGLSPFASTLDPGFPPGRPDPAVPGERMMRGLIIAWAIDPFGPEIRWNHLLGETTIINYLHASAWSYQAWALPAVAPVDHGQPLDPPGTWDAMLHTDGFEYASAPDQLLLNFHSVNAPTFSGPTLVMSNTDLTLHPVSTNLGTTGGGPVTTKAHFDLWNANEVKFSGTHRCITCWDQTFLRDYGTPNHFLLVNLQTRVGKARIDGRASILCDIDFDPVDGLPFGADPRDIVSEDAALLGVAAKHLSFGAGDARERAGTNLTIMGAQDATIRTTPPLPPPLP